MYKSLIWLSILVALIWAVADHSYEAILALLAMLIMALSDANICDGGNEP